MPTTLTPAADPAAVSPAEKAQAAAAGRAPTTLQRDEHLRFLLRNAAQLAKSAQRLRKQWEQRIAKHARDLDLNDALWEGWWALKHERERTDLSIRDRGGLLHIGAPGALA